MKVVLTEEDKKRISQAVADAETVTAGEIVPFIVRSSNSYEIALWKAAAIGVMGAFGVLSILMLIDSWRWGGTQWWQDPAFQKLVLICSGALMAGLVWKFPSLRRRFAGSKRMIRSVHRRAMASFVEREVFNTRDRTGILLFVSLFEHRIEIIGDAGINEKVAIEDWAAVLFTIRKGIKAGNLAEGMIRGIELCGELLAESGIEIKADDTNELSNQVLTDL